jgi:hypothetical protein
MPAHVLAMDQIMYQLPSPFWKDGGFWISFVIGVGGLLFSILAWVEAKRAKRAATLAGRTVKFQTIMIELSEIVQKLDKVQPGIRFSEARDLIADTSRRVHRATSPFSHEPKLAEAIQEAKQAVEAARSSLASLRPAGEGTEAEAPNAVYYGIEAECTGISNAVSELIGLFEKQAFDFGEVHA